ncbi:hypothetical protein M8494_09985 [Serratia ureilytica]
MLLWLAMSFSLFSTMIAVLVYVLWCHLAIDFGLLSTTLDMKVLQNTVSMRLGIALLALGPIAVASMNYARNAAAHAGARGESRCVDPRADAQCVYAARRASDRPERRAGVRHDARHRLLQIDQ